MAIRSISRVFVITVHDGVAKEIENLLKRHHLDIQIQNIPLSKYGNAILDKNIIRTLTSVALESDFKVEDIEYLIAHAPSVVEIMSRPNNRVKWVQCTSAGVDVVFNSLQVLKMDPEFVMSRTTGAERGQMMAEYVIGHIIARERDFSLLERLQREASYDRSKIARYRMLTQLTIGILGLGRIGTEVARACKVLNMRVLVGVRDERFESGELATEYAHEFIPMSRLSELLEQVDYLVCVLPSTVETKILLSGEVLKPCQAKKTILINTGRGDLIDDQSLINAISQGWLGGAILDVFNKEPLPSDSPLWTLPGVTITPHVSCMSSGSSNMIAKEYVDNVLQYIKGDKLNNQVDFSKGY